MSEYRTETQASGDTRDGNSSWDTCSNISEPASDSDSVFSIVSTPSSLRSISPEYEFVNGV